MPEVRSPAPTFDSDAVVEHGMVRFTWAELHAKRWLLLAFYPMDSPTDVLADLVALESAAERLRRLDVRVAVVVPQSIYAILGWTNQPRNEGGLGAFAFPILSDPDEEIAVRYGVPAPGGDKLYAHFLVDPKGVIRREDISSIPSSGPVQSILLSIEALEAAREKECT